MRCDKSFQIIVSVILGIMVLASGCKEKNAGIEEPGISTMSEEHIYIPPDSEVILKEYDFNKQANEIEAMSENEAFITEPNDIADDMNEAMEYSDEESNVELMEGAEEKIPDANSFLK